MHNRTSEVNGFRLINLLYLMTLLIINFHLRSTGGTKDSMNGCSDYSYGRNTADLYWTVVIVDPDHEL